MRKVVIVTEGQTELIFVRNLLRNTVDNSRLSFECVQLRGNSERTVPYSHIGPNAEFHFLIVDVGNDESVMSAITERERYYFEKGFEKIIGIRDMYCARYRKRSKVICDEVTKQFIDGHNEVVQGMKNPERIVICFSVMEIEAWFISMHTLLQKVDSVLTVEYIESRLGFNLRSIDPQRLFFHPSDELSKILELCGRTYAKSRGDVEMVTSRVDMQDVGSGTEGGRCASLKEFLDQIAL
ncbi:MAG TPA: DUF4276 family protein [Syntrophorhabdales bacterium]|nr:DUF4276 family protein [Syntrophorhabdales bacterium]